MSSENHVSSRTPNSFGNYRIASGIANLSAVANAVVAMPILGGGLTGSGANNTSGAVIVRRITVTSRNNGNVNSANVSVGWTNDGGNLVANAQVLTNITANNTYTDLTMSGTANSALLTGNVSSTLFVNVGTSAAANIVTFNVYGDVVQG